MSELILLFLRLGLTAFGGPAAHVALIERACVRERQWLSHDEFLALLGVSNLIPGPTSTELAMHVGRRRAGWPGLVAAGLAFIVPSAMIVGVLAAIYVAAGDLPLVRYIVLAVQPVVIVVILDALVPLSRSALRTPPAVVVAVGAIAASLAGLSEILVLMLAGLTLLVTRPSFAVAVAVIAPACVLATVRDGVVPAVTDTEVFAYFFRTGSLLFGSGYVLLPVLEGDLVHNLRWLTARQLLDAVAAGQATPGPVFTTATFVGYVLRGVPGAVAATVGMFLPAFLFAALSSVAFERLNRSTLMRRFLAGVNAAAVALIALTLFSLARATLQGPVTLAIALCAFVLIFVVRTSPMVILTGAAVCGAIWSVFVT